jgi:DNA-binding NarL/FixJ family response regulator
MAPATERLRVVLADDHELYRDGLRAVLSSLGRTEVVGEASTGVEAVALAAQLRPDVVLMDLNMPELNGIEATRQIVAGGSGAAVLVLTMLEDADSLFAAMRAGARGYLLKDADETEILRAIEASAAGEAIFGAALAQRVLEYFSNPPAPVVEVPFPELTDRERDVLDLMAAGYNNSAIATRLALSGKTVRNRVSNIFCKLQVAHRAEAIVRAR